MLSGAPFDLVVGTLQFNIADPLMNSGAGVASTFSVTDPELVPPFPSLTV
jgi:hypothetical protein